MDQWYRNYRRLECRNVFALVMMTMADAENSREVRFLD